MTMKGEMAKLMMMYAMAGVFMGGGELNRNTADYSDKEQRNFMDRIKEHKRRLLLKRGMQTFDFPNGIEIVALNKKNAQRKYENYKKTIL
jgi:hypothetical protein